MSYWTIKQKILFVDINLHLIKIVCHFMEANQDGSNGYKFYIIFVNKYLNVSSLMSYWTSKQKILFVDIDLHLIKIVCHFMKVT